MQYYGIDWLATVCGVSAVYLLGNKNKLGFILFMMASLSWAIVGLLVGSWAMILGSSTFFVLHMRGFLNWRRSEK